ncbi:MAG: hypothetical protein J1F65_02730 [Clostridiales bacterium]|nr:hypothetical protein [Clostridiales bacterium]
MKLTRAKNDATLNKVGDIYQYLIALRDCFELNEDDILHIEVNGDVSVISNITGGFQKEVKHHVKNTNLSDRDIDFWKTLANWYEEYDRIKVFSELILHTTARIVRESSFYNWNSLLKEDKLSRLKKIGLIKKESELKFREQYDRIFNDNFSEQKLLDILNKFQIEPACVTIVGISKIFDKYISNIPKQNRDNYIGALLGCVLIQVKDPPHKWEITRDQFEQITQEVSVGYIKDGVVPLPDEYADVEVPQNQLDALQQKRFVEAIRDIDYDKMIPGAISDYWKTDLTIARYFRDNPIYLKSLNDYENSLKDKLFYTKSNSEIEAEGFSSDDKKKIAKKLYNCVMIWKAEDFGSIVSNRDFFQHGVIHNMVDAGDFIWKIEGEENEHK